MAHDRRVLVAGDDHHRHAGPLGAQEQQAGVAAHARHAQVEQHQIHVRRLFERGGEGLEIRRLMDLGVGYRPHHRLAQRAKHQRMIVGDEHPDRVVQSDSPRNSDDSCPYPKVE